MPIKHKVGDWTSTNIQYFLCKRDFKKACFAAEPDQGHRGRSSSEMKLGALFNKFFKIQMVSKCHS